MYMYNVYPSKHSSAAIESEIHEFRFDNAFDSHFNGKIIFHVTRATDEFRFAFGVGELNTFYHL